MAADTVVGGYQRNHARFRGRARSHYHIILGRFADLVGPRVGAETMRNICVYCGSHPGHDSRYRQAAEALGQLRAERRYGLVYGGGGQGLMGVIANAVLTHGGEVNGVIPSMTKFECS